MPNTGGVRASKRRVMASAVMSGLLYAAEAWQAATKWASAMAIMNRVIRLLAVRICSAYRTVQADDVMVVAGGWDLSGGGRGGGEGKEVGQRKGVRGVAGEGGKEKIMDEDTHPGSAGGFLTGHGENKVYLKRMKKREDDRCEDCGELDVPGHAVLRCVRWERERVAVEIAIGERLEETNVVRIMLRESEKWEAVARLVQNS
ncbi:uncharacterized protein LOC116182433, partial [Photinus pyralis]|uniref:uncharacterized protein LOC116182433 n=1 Tax=Photinus pyralis TaxID=7054 RepID=UPI0012677E16